MGLGRGGENFNDDHEIDQRIKLAILEDLFAACDDGVRMEIAITTPNAHAEAGGVVVAAAVPMLAVEGGRNVGDNPAMVAGRSRHRDEATAAVLTLKRGDPLCPEIFLAGDQRVWEGGHGRGTFDDPRDNPRSRKTLDRDR